MERVSSVVYSFQIFFNSIIGEGLKFCYMVAIKILLKAHKLCRIALTRLVEILLFINGSTLTRSLGIIALGIKLVDIACKDLITLEYINIPSSNTCFLESRERYFLLEIILTKDFLDIFYCLGLY